MVKNEQNRQAAEFFNGSAACYYIKTLLIEIVTLLFFVISVFVSP